MKVTSNRIYQALGGIDPALILDAAPTEDRKRTRTRRYLRWSALAATLALILCAGALLWPRPQTPSTGDSSQTPDKAPTVWFGNFQYFPIAEHHYEDFPEIQHLFTGDAYEWYYAITEDDLGECLGVFPANEVLNLPEGLAYRYVGLPDCEALIIVDHGEEQSPRYRFYVSEGNDILGGRRVPSSLALDIHDLPDSALSLTLALPDGSNAAPITDPALLEELCAILGGKEAADYTVIQEQQWQNWYAATGDPRITLENGELKYDDIEVMKEYAPFVNKNLHTLYFETSTGFSYLQLLFDSDYHYVQFCRGLYLLSPEESARLAEILGIETE